MVLVPTFLFAVPAAAEPAIHDNFRPGPTAFWSRTHGLLGGQVHRGVIALTNDAGQTWETVHWTRKKRFVLELDVAADGHAWAEVGCYECRTTLLHSSDGGRHWKPVSRTRVRDVSFVDAAHGWGIRSILTRSNKISFFLMTTKSGGRGWKRHGEVCRRGYWIDAFVSRVSVEEGWVVCGSEPATQQQEKGTRRSLDGGATWQRRGLPFWGGHVANTLFLDDGYGWLWGARNTIQRTTDGGSTWGGLRYFEADADSIYGVSFVTPRAGYVSWANSDRRGGLQLSRTMNAGRDWSVVQSWD